MLTFTRLLTAVALLVAALPLAAAEKDDKKKTEPKSDARASTSNDYVVVGEYDFVVASGPGKDGGSIKVRGNKLTLQQGNRGKGNLKAVEDDPTIELTPDVKVRLIKLPVKKDEKGITIPYTEKELKELRGDSNLRGYNAELDDVKAGKIVTLHVLKLRNAKGDDAEKRFADRIYIKGDAPTPPAGANQGERKEKK
jgi:hypothetical protein